MSSLDLIDKSKVFNKFIKSFIEVIIMLPPNFVPLNVFSKKSLIVSKIFKNVPIKFFRNPSSPFAKYLYELVASNASMINNKINLVPQLKVLDVSLWG